MPLKMTSLQAKAVLEALIAEDGAWDPAAVFVGIYTAVNNQGVNTVIGDITPPGGSTATRQAVTTWTAPTLLSNGSWAADSPPIEFRPATTGDATTLHGFYLATAVTAGALMFFGAVSPPVSLPGPDVAWNVVVRLIVDPSGKWDVSVMWNG